MKVMLSIGLTNIEIKVILWTIGFSAIVQLVWFKQWERHVHSERQRAYVLSLLSSFITSVGSLPFVYQVLFHLPRGNLNALLMDETFMLLAVGLTTFFMTFLCLDLLIGWFRYRNKIDPLTGWVHHMTYLGVLTWVLRQHYSPIFVAMCVLEIPTFILALGSVHRAYRSDTLFALTFVSTRIVFHTFMISSAFSLYRFGAITLALAAFLPLHCYWFFGFIQQQKRLYQQRKKKNISVTIQPSSTKVSINKKPINVSSIKKRPGSINTERLRRHLPSSPADFSNFTSQHMIQRLADRLPDNLSRDLYRSSERLREFWDRGLLQQQQQQQEDHAHSITVTAH
ncbi:uncharacterized protein BX664DRAFT_387111 [Halteromyces radiatus]|uniref:uncharacterized protein n=1 Tax=Halteromyces radiatus TaxID=101107 RepID=UPI0022207538|nr:uncharacterized protein BX664DRAFT_387111 [Halteromyces radiatus]KAI8086745.1 hypothetical protein BX664DRAFT_387111 [Halteromyces radiatus]